MYLRKIFAHLKDNELLRWVASHDFIYIDFLGNEVLNCVLWACWKGVEQLEVLLARNCNVYSLEARLAGGSSDSSRSLERIRRECLERVMPFPLENMSLFCASGRGLRDFFFFFDTLCLPPEKSELLKTNKNTSLKMFLSLLMLTRILLP